MFREICAMHRIDIVHQRRRGDDAAEINRGGKKQNNRKKPAAIYSSTASICLFDIREGAD